MAETYADLVIAALVDQPPPCPEEPIYLLEIGSGTGRLAFNLIRELLRKQSYFPQTRSLKFVMILSDVVEENVRAWEQHRRFAGLGGAVDFARYAAGSGELFRLRRSGQVLEKLQNPLFVVANYVFDSLPHDEFKIENGQILECLVDVVPRAVQVHSEKNRLDVRDVELPTTYRPIDPARYYKDPDCTALLQHYAREVKQGAVTIPVASIALLKELRKLGSLRLLASDRGFTTPDTMCSYPIHPWALHEGCFSFMVNFHAICSLFAGSLYTTHQFLDGIQTVYCTDEASGEMPHLFYTFRERLDRSNAVNNAASLYKLVRDEVTSAALLGFIRLNLCDPYSLSAVAIKLAPLLKGIRYAEGHDTVQVLEEVWRNDFHLQGSPNVSFWLGHLYQTLGMFERALEFYAITMERQGEDSTLWTLSGQCQEGLGRLSAALECYDKALVLEPRMPEASQARTEVQRALAGVQVSS